MTEATPHSRTVPDAFRTYGEQQLDHSPAFGHGKDGICDVTAVREPGERTRLLNEYVRVPYHLTGTLDEVPPSELITLCLQEPTGGIAQGDRHRLAIDAREDAYCRITTQSASKVHSMQANYAHLDASMTAHDGAYVAYLPGPTILNEDARCLQTTTVDVAPDAVVVVGDVVVPDGLTAHDPFTFDHYHSRVTARVDGALACLDTTDLVPGDQPVGTPAVMGDHAVFGSVYIFAPRRALSELMDRIHDRLVAMDPIEGGISALPEDMGATVRLLGDRGTDVQTAVEMIAETARNHLLCTGMIDQ